MAENIGGKVMNACLFDMGYLVLFRLDGKIKLLGITRERPLEKPWKIETIQKQDDYVLNIMDLNANNAALVRRYIKWTAPSACGSNGLSIGIGGSEIRKEILDEFKNRNIKPVLVDCTPNDIIMSKINFLTLTDNATWEVLAANYRNGYGANASGLTTEEEIVKALLYGYSMIGIDPSDKIVQENVKASDEILAKKFQELPMEFQAAVNASYLDADFKVGQDNIKFESKEVHRIVLEYGEVIMHIQYIYNTYFKSTPWPIDLELSIKYGGKVLTTKEHYFIANELERNGVKIASFLFDAQDNIDNETWRVHAEIANNFGYRLAITHADKGNINYREFLKIAKGKAHLKVESNERALKLLKTI